MRPEPRGLGRIPGLEQHIREYRNGRDLTASPRDVLVIDLFGLSADEVRERFPEVYQWVRERVKPERDQNRRDTYRTYWWIFGEPRKDLRPALRGLDRFISTVETSRHRFFVALDQSILADNKLINIATADTWHLGVLSSRVHIAWAMRTGSWLGVGNDSVYVKTRCFETFPFPGTPTSVGTWGRRTSVRRDDGPRATEVAPTQGPVETGVPGGGADIGTLAAQIDTHRKRQQQLHPDLTLTNCYNCLERLRRITAATPERPEPPLTAKERQIHEQGLISVLAQLHDELDAAVLRAYGWDDLIPALVGKPGGTTPLPDKPREQAAAEEALLTRLVALNAERAAEEARGLVRWLRPEFQNPDGRGTDSDAATIETETIAPAQPNTGKRPWPKTLPEQFQAVRELVAAQATPVSPEQIARRFSRAPTKKVAELIDTLAALGQIQQFAPD